MHMRYLSSTPINMCVCVYIHTNLSSFSPGDNRKHKNENSKNKYGNTHFDVELEKVNLN